jgi:hypothetical protein
MAKIWILHRVVGGSGVGIMLVFESKSEYEAIGLGGDEAIPSSLAQK